MIYWTQSKSTKSKHERREKTKGKAEICEQVSLEEREERLPSTLLSVNHAPLSLPQSTRVVGEQGEIVGEKEREVGVPGLGCNEVLCVFLSFSPSLSLLLRNGTVRAMSTFINRHNSGSARSLVFHRKKKEKKSIYILHAIVLSKS